MLSLLPLPTQLKTDSAPLAPPDRLLDPQGFILHLHVYQRENRTCHWGFDPAHWRSYLHLDEDAYRWEDERAEAARRLGDVKRRFEEAHPKLKRKQVGNQRRRSAHNPETV